MSEPTQKEINTARKQLFPIEGGLTGFHDDGRGVPTLGPGYTPIHYNSKSKHWAVSPTLGEDLKAAGITLTPDHKASLKRMETAMNEGGVKGNPTVAEEMKNLADIQLKPDQAKILFTQAYNRNRPIARKAIGEKIFDGLSDDRKAVFGRTAYQSPNAIHKAGPDIGRAIQARDHEAVADHIRTIGKSLKDPRRYESEAELYADSKLPGKIIVKSGDTLSAIAKRNNMTVEEIQKLNDFEDLDKIRTGSVIKVTPDDSANSDPEDAPITGGKGQKDLKGGAGDDQLDLVAELGKPGRSIDDILLKKPEQWTETEVRDVMKERMRRPLHDPERTGLWKAEQNWFKHFYGDGPAEADETGKTVSPQPVRPIPEKPVDARTADGQPLGDELGRFAKYLSVSKGDTPDRDLVRGLQSGINMLGMTKQTQPTASRGKQPLNGYPILPNLKEDGVFGAKSRSGLKRALAHLGRSKLEEGAALGRFQAFAGDNRPKSYRDLKDTTERGIGPLFRDPGKPTREPKIEATTLQETLNDTGARHFGPSWKALKIDGDIGPKTYDAFAKVRRAAGPRGLTERFGKFLGFL